jgi:hypothetical protein
VRENGLATFEVFDPEPVQLRNAGYITAFAGKFGIIIEGLSYKKLQESYDRWGSGLGQTRYERARQTRSHLNLAGLRDCRTAVK